MSISENEPVNQLETFEKPCFVIVFDGLYDGLELRCPKC